jgi:PPOX class probable F420-dependent enzyme
MTTAIPESHHDLFDAPVATLATIDPDGRPQLTAVWFLADPERIRISLNTSRQKVRNLERNPAAAVFILDPANPFRYLEVRGDATLEPDPDYTFAAEVGKKYGADVKAYDKPEDSRLVLTLTPTTVNAVVAG